MITKIINKTSLKDLSAKDNLSYWMSRPPDERIAAVEYLRKQTDGSTARLQRVAKVIQRPQS